MSLSQSIVTQEQRHGQLIFTLTATDVSESVLIFPDKSYGVTAALTDV